MSYNDELGVILDKCAGDDLEFFATEILKLNRQKILEMTNSHRLYDLRRLCSYELRSAAGHSLCNLWRGKHELPYIRPLAKVNFNPIKSKVQLPVLQEVY